jgi:hypothetical protein
MNAPRADFELGAPLLAASARSGDFKIINNEPVENIFFPWVRTSAATTGGVKDAKNLDGVVADAVGDDVGRSGNDEFACAGNAPGAAKSGKAAEVLDGVFNCRNDPGGRCGTVAGDLGGFGVEIGQGFAQPSNAHAGSICAACAGPVFRWQNRRGRLPPRLSRSPQSASC